MPNEAKIFRNPSKNSIEVTYNNQITVWGPGEAKPINGDLARHITLHVNNALVEVSQQDLKAEVVEEETEKTTVNNKKKK